jgi:hypothetical protein
MREELPYPRGNEAIPARSVESSNVPLPRLWNNRSPSLCADPVGGKGPPSPLVPTARFGMVGFIEAALDIDRNEYHSSEAGKRS